MQNTNYRFNEMDTEPTDDQLDELMKCVAIEARNKSKNAREKMMEELRREVDRAVETIPVQ
jgi:hypothetical protein